MRIIILALLVAGCASTNKVRMKNCELVKEGIYICEEIPEKPIREFGPRR